MIKIHVPDTRCIRYPFRSYRCRNMIDNPSEKHPVETQYGNSRWNVGG